MELNICMLLTSQHLQSTPLWLLSDLEDHLILPSRLRSQIWPESLDPSGSLALRTHVNNLLSTEHWTLIIWPLPLASGLSPCSNASQPDFQSALAFTSSRPAFATQSKSKQDLWAPNPGFALNPIRIDIKQLGSPYFRFLILPHLIILHFKHPDLPIFYNPLESDTAYRLHAQCEQKLISFFYHLKST